MSNGQDIILVDFGPASGVRGVAMVSVDQLQEKSAEAIDKAMGTIRGMAAKVMASVNQIKVAERPTSVEVTFGIKLTAAGDALVAKVGAEASVTVTLTWEHQAYPTPALKK
jgi:hypothetical protein